MRKENSSDNSIDLHKQVTEPLRVRLSAPDSTSGEEFRRVLHQSKVHQFEVETQNNELRTARLELERLYQLTEELEARNKELDVFAYTVCHDLKNPLGIILGYAGLLEDDSKTLSSENIHFSMTAIAKSANKMNEIINGLLLLAQLDRIKIPIKPLDTTSIMAGVRHVLGQMIAEYQAIIVMPDAWPVALGYDPWIELVWTNYLSNAMKYGGKPPRIELGATEQHEGMVRFWVRDNGPGLTPDAQSRLFVPFTRLAPDRAEGNGLGLSIVQRIVERLGGQTSVESEPGQGSIFGFSLPRSIN